MSALHQCFAGQAVTRRLASACLLGPRREGTAAVARSGPWAYRSHSSKLGTGKGNERRLTVNDDKGFGYGRGYDGHVLQWRRGLCSGSEAQVTMSSGARCATWFIKDPTRVMPSDVVSILPALRRSDDISHTVPVLLVTPAFASWAVNTHPFLRESITHLFQNARPNISGGHASFVYSVVAVVDKLPVPSTNSILREGEECGDKLAGQHACEGISLFLADRDAVTAKVAQSLQSRDMSTPETEPTLSYLYRQASTKNSPTVAAFAEVGIRLANTIFHNGKLRTMLASRWCYNSHPNSKHASPTLTLDKEYDLLSCQINGAAKPHEVTAHIPLHPVTKPRVITTSMGNIISQLRRQAEGSSATIHASAELEKALPAYLNANNLQNQRVAVWALVQPVSSQGEPHATSDMSAAAAADSLVAINEGARLHRVVSGGGGWGKKQGLLSLDPEYNYQTGGDAALGSGRVRPVDELFEEAAEDIGEERELMANLFGESVPGSIQFKDGRLTTDLSEIAKEGDTVQFLVAPLDSLQASSSAAAEKKGEKILAVGADPEKRTMRVSFGVIPSSETEFGEETSDDIHQVSVSCGDGDGDGDGDGGIVAVPNYFGALSEKGLVYSVFNEIAPEYGNERGGLEQLVQGTKIDVPGSRIMIESVE
ncbi:hypothetical protein GX51_05511 [Blastomyces parvus]|uniref:Uncharacterized protein n=1 Tax=Blastomyces parvus TaxID=2060905 RepID=A0A2B7WWT7_9EURO|nr:hypothetical protein GX51_05511 [Blastomyces parvus]